MHENLSEKNARKLIWKKSLKYSYGSLPFENSPVLPNSGQMINININKAEYILVYMGKIQLPFDIQSLFAEIHFK